MSKNRLQPASTGHARSASSTPRLALDAARASSRRLAERPLPKCTTARARGRAGAGARCDSGSMAGRADELPAPGAIGEITAFPLPGPAGRAFTVAGVSLAYRTRGLHRADSVPWAVGSSRARRHQASRARRAGRAFAVARAKRAGVRPGVRAARTRRPRDYSQRCAVIACSSFRRWSSTRSRFASPVSRSSTSRCFGLISFNRPIALFASSGRSRSSASRALPV